MACCVLVLALASPVRIRSLGLSSPTGRRTLSRRVVIEKQCDQDEWHSDLLLAFISGRRLAVPGCAEAPQHLRPMNQASLPYAMMFPRAMTLSWPSCPYFLQPTQLRSDYQHYWQQGSMLRWMF